MYLTTMKKACNGSRDIDDLIILVLVPDRSVSCSQLIKLDRTVTDSQAIVSFTNREKAKNGVKLEYSQMGVKGIIQGYKKGQCLHRLG